MTTQQPIVRIRIGVRLRNPTAEYPIRVYGNPGDFIVDGRSVGIQDIDCRTIREAWLYANGLSHGLQMQGRSSSIELDHALADIPKD